ncbi:unnamed protein product [Rotaria socialis]|uniref:VASt domain-containing protein n=1 Tax=Rotaria socialis TaxID=392032 RepID=A0A820FHG5_9BILA|nr:unnamed protein product [Rotaria socialis]
MKKFVHRRMASLPLLDNILAKNMQRLSSSSEISPIPQTPIEENDQVILISSSLLTDTQRSNSLTIDKIGTLNEESSNIETVPVVECLSNTEIANAKMVVVTSPSFNSDLSLEQNDSINQLNPSSSSFLETKQRRIDHRRNKSEPFKCTSTEDIPSAIELELSSASTTSNESQISNNSLNQIRRKSSTKTDSNNIPSLKTVKQIAQEKSSPSAITSRKKKPWYNLNVDKKILKSDETSNSDGHFPIDTEYNQSSSSDKFSCEALKSFLSIQSSSTSVVCLSELVHSELETCSGFSTPLTENRKDTLVAYNVFESPFQCTYRQRNEEFRKLFKELPIDERLIVDYSCAWQKDILIQGRIYLSQNYLCFYANILNWKTSLYLKFQDIVAIAREKTAKVIPNAIEIKSNKAEKYFFASFVARDKSYALMLRIWQNVLNNQSIPAQQLWTMIHESYGDDLDMTTDEEDIYHKTSPKEQIQANGKYDLSNIVLRITPNSINSKSSQQEDDCSSVSSHGEHHTDDDDDDDGIIPIEEKAATDTLKRQPQSNLSKHNMNLSPEICYLAQCPCQSHLATELINRTYSMSVERLLDCIFGDNEFLVAYRASRRIKDFRASEWQVNSETGKRERLCTYRVIVSAVIGSTTVISNEKQVIDCELAKSHFVLDTEIRNEGIKYADAFYVASRYCLVQIGPNKSHLKVTCEVRYVKSLMAIIKTFIEKNAMAALQDSFNDLNNRVLNYHHLIGVLCDSVKRMDQESSKRPRAHSTSDNNEKENITVLNTRSLEHQQSDELTSSINDLSTNSQQEDSIQDEISSNISVPDKLCSSKNAFLLSFCLFTMFILLIVNIFLCIKLNQIDHMTDHLLQVYPTWLNKYSYQQEDSEWSLSLKRQEEYYQTQLNNLQSVLVTTHNALKNVTSTLYASSKLSSQ